MYKVHIGSDDPDFYLTDQPDHMADWAKVNCGSFHSWTTNDYSDVDSWTGDYDTYTTFRFKDEEDAFMFALKFQGTQ